MLIFSHVKVVVCLRAGLLEGFACSSHGGEEGLLLPLCGYCGGLGHGSSILLHSLHSDGGDLLLLECETGVGAGARASHGQGGGDDWVGWSWVVAHPSVRVRLEISGSKKKKTPIIILERECRPKWMIVLIGIVYII
jgi:hypothetical protein